VLDEFTKAAPDVRNSRMVAIGRDGCEHVAHLAWTAADIARGLSDSEAEEKVAKLTRDLMVPARRRALLDLLWRLDELPDVVTLVDRLEV